MVADGVGDDVALALGAGIIATHDALQFGELSNHACDKVGLAQTRCAFSVIGTCAFDDTFFDQPACQLCDTLDLVGYAAKLLVKGNLGQFLRLIIQRDLQVLFPEEFRVRQPRSQHLLIARNNRSAAIMRVNVGGTDERIGKLASAVMADKIFLVHARGQLDDLLRHLQKRGIKPAKHRHWPFGQACIFDNQTFVRNQRQASGLRSGFRPITDDAAAFGEMYEDMAGAQLLDIVASIADGDRAAVMETMAHGYRAADDAVNFAMHDIITQ